MQFTPLFIMILLSNILLFEAYHSINKVLRNYKQTTIYMTKQLKIRPTIDDIERISYGQAAKRRGTGSRAVPHRLNALERKEWDLAKRRRYLLLRGTGWRKERGDSPLANIYRNYCDAVAIPCISVRRGVQDGNLLYDEVVIDFSPLRTNNINELVDLCINEAKNNEYLIGYDDMSDINMLGWPNMNEILESEVIWRLPTYGLLFKYNDRKICKNYAERIAQLLANGEIIKDRNNYDDINESED